MPAAGWAQFFRFRGGDADFRFSQVGRHYPSSLSLRGCAYTCSAAAPFGPRTPFAREGRADVCRRGRMQPARFTGPMHAAPIAPTHPPLPARARPALLRRSLLFFAARPMCFLGQPPALLSGMLRRSAGGLGRAGSEVRSRRDESMRHAHRNPAGRLNGWWFEDCFVG